MMKRQPKSARKTPKARPNRTVSGTEVPAGKELSTMESVASTENELVDSADHEELETAEREYDGRSPDQEDGAIPMDVPDQNPIPDSITRKPGRPPQHNL